MNRIYNKIDEPEILMKDVTIPEHFPAIYIDEDDNVYCYHSIIDNDRFIFGSSPYYLKGKNPQKIKDNIRGYFEIKNGAVFKSKRFIDEKDYFKGDKKCKLLLASIRFPEPNDMSYRVCCNSKYEQLEEFLTRKIFVLTCKELKELLEVYNIIFNCVPNSIYRRYPSITRAIKSDNFCEISDTWIPAKFPYIAFAESNYYYSHVSLYGFYEHIRFLTMGSIDSYVSQLFINNGLNKNILENILNYREIYSFSERITSDVYDYLDN